MFTSHQLIPPQASLSKCKPVTISSIFSQRSKLENTHSKITWTCQRFARNFVQTRLGGEFGASDVIIHKAYCKITFDTQLKTALYWVIHFASSQFAWKNKMIITLSVHIPHECLSQWGSPLDLCCPLRSWRLLFWQQEHFAPCAAHVWWCVHCLHFWVFPADVPTGLVWLQPPEWTDQPVGKYQLLLVTIWKAKI